MTPQEKANYRMPPASLGLCVWRPNPYSTEGVPAVITKIGSRSVLLTIWPPDNRAGIPKDGVMHASDPEFLDRPGNDSGVWDYIPEQLAIRARQDIFDAGLAALELQVAELKASLT